MDAFLVVRFRAVLPSRHAVLHFVALLAAGVFFCRVSTAQERKTVVGKDLPLKASEKVDPARMLREGDTLVFSVPLLMSEEDWSLTDVIARLPGFTIGKDEEVLMYDEEISRFYLDGEDVFGHRYNIALGSIDPRDVRELRIYLDHQPLRTLDGYDKGSSAALDVRLKKKVGSGRHALLQGEVGGGQQVRHLPYAALGTLMYLGKRFRTFNLLRTDATGDRIALSLNPTGVSSDSRNPSFSGRYVPRSFIAIQHSFAPVDETYSRFNRSWSALSVNRVRLGKDLNLSVSGLYENERLSSENSVVREYRLDDSLKRFEDRNDVFSHAYLGRVAVKAELNRKRFYLMDNVQLEMSGSRSGNRITGTGFRQERARQGNAAFLNDVRYVRRTRKGSLEIDMITQYTEQEELLAVKASEDTLANRQRIDGSHFYNDLRLKYTVDLSEAVQMYFETKAGYLGRDFGSDITGVDIASPLLGNSLSLSSFRPSEYVYLEYSGTVFSFNLGTELRYQYLGFSGDVDRRAHLFAFNPTLELEVAPTDELTLLLEGHYALTPVNEQAVYRGLVMTDYRDFVKGRTALRQTPGYGARFTLDYKNPDLGYYFRAKAVFDGRRSFVLNRYILGDYVLHLESDEITDFSSFQTGVDFSKTFLRINGKVHARFEFSTENSSILQNGAPSVYDRYLYTAEWGYLSELSRWMRLDYSGGFSHTSYREDGQWSGETVNAMSHALRLTVLPHESLEMDVSAVYCFNRIGRSVPGNTVFLNASLRCHVTPALMVFVRAKNILDQDVYTFSSVAPLETFRFHYRMRPFNILTGLSVKF